MGHVTYIRPSATIPLSHAVVHGGLVYVSGQVGFRPGTSDLASDDIAGQCRQTFENIDAILAEAGASRASILRCGVFLKNIADFAAMNRCYSEWLGSHRPARTTVGADFARADILIEVDCIAALPPSKG